MMRRIFIALCLLASWQLAPPAHAQQPLTPKFIQGGWTPVDSSGGNLTFTNFAGSYQRVAGLVTAYATLTYPTNSDSHAAVIGGLPVVVSTAGNAATQTLVSQCAISVFPSAVALMPQANTKNIAIMSTNGASTVLNSTLSGGLLVFECTYPASLFPSFPIGPN